MVKYLDALVLWCGAKLRRKYLPLGNEVTSVIRWESHAPRCLSMAGSKFAYVRKFELPDPLLPGTFMVLRLDGHAFHRYVVTTR